MKRILTLILLLMATKGSVYALGLGNIDLNSSLNEPFDARIELLSTTAEEMVSIKAGLADAEAFRRAKIDRPFYLSRLKFSVRESEDSPDYIRIYTTEPVREPFLNFLIEVSWSNGRLYREYTVLLDPPLYDPTSKMPKLTKSVKPVVPAAKSEIEGHKVVYEEDFARHISAPKIMYTGGDYGPTESTDTLWSIATTMRPDDSISVNQMMLALLRTNPEAFINNNINGLKRGQILRMPEAGEINALTVSEALAEVKSQYAAWGDSVPLSTVVEERPAVSMPGAAQADTAPSAEREMVTGDEAANEAELRLVTPQGDGQGSDQATLGEEGAKTGTADSDEALILAKESVEVLSQENAELKDKLHESEVLIDDLKRLIALKDDELVSLQNQLAQSQVESVTPQEMEAAEEQPTAPIEEMPEEAGPVEEPAEEMAPVEEPEAAGEAVSTEEAMDQGEEVVAEEEVAGDAGTAEGADVTAPPSGVMAMVNQYLGPVKDILLGNRMIGMAVGGILLVLILIGIFKKVRDRQGAMPEAESITTEFPDFNEGEIEGFSITDSEAVTAIDESEAVTVLPEEMEESGAAAGEREQKKAPVAVPEQAEQEEDPMQEVNTYLAFEQFDQAEEYVRNALEREPENAEFHIKLLEVFYTSGNKKSYEEAARVLHDKLGEKGEHWSMAVAMWQEMSPSRALFETPVDGEVEESADAAAPRGIVDITGDDEAAEDAGLDFDLGTEAKEDAGKTDEDMLDITAAVDTSSEDILDVTAAVGLVEDEASDSISDSDDEMFNLTTGSEDEGTLDITAGPEGDETLDITAGVDEEGALDFTTESAEEDMLDLTAESDSGEDEALDITAGVDEEGTLDFTTESAEEDMLDLTAESDSGEDEALDITAGVDEDGALDFTTESAEEDMLDLTAESDSGEDETLDIEGEENILDVSEDTRSGVDLLDVTSSMTSSAESKLGLDSAEEDLLDVTAAASTDADNDELLGSDIDSESEDVSAEDENVIDFDIGGVETESDEDESTGEDSSNVVEFDITASGAEQGDEGDDLGLDFESDAGDDAGGFELDLSDSSDDAGNEFSLDIEGDDTTANDLDSMFDLSGEGNEDAGDEIDMNETMEIKKFNKGLSMDDEEEVESEIPEIDLTQDNDDIDIDGTVEIPNIDEMDTDDDEGGAQTVFVPRSSQPEEQSDEEEITTKLDLAKAYIELGDHESAKSILDEVMAEGNIEQQQQAQELLAQI